jgi:hypothetical protein
MSYSLIYGYKHIVGTNYLHIQDRNIYVRLLTTTEDYSVSKNVKSFIKKNNHWWFFRYITDLWQGYVKGKFEEYFLSYLGDAASEVEENPKRIRTVIWFRFFFFKV